MVTIATKENHPLYGGMLSKNYNIAFKRFNDTQDCLINDQKSSANPDLRLIDWDQFQSLQEAELCIWYIFTSLENPTEAEKWIRFHNPTYVRLLELTAETIGDDKINRQNTFGYNLDSKWEKRDGKMPYPTHGLPLLTEGAFRPGFSLQSEWSETKKLKKLISRWCH